MKIEYATRQLIRSSSRGYLSTEFNTENLSKGLYTFCFIVKGEKIDKKVIVY